jgi:hypothetical protein
MREFFKGWRRKTGVVTLMLACVFMACWVRSQTTYDVLSVCDCSVLSYSGDFCFDYYARPNSHPTKWESGAISRDMEFVGVPYSFVVLPLTLLSAYLLLSKPRKPVPKMRGEPIPDGV